MSAHGNQEPDQYSFEEMVERLRRGHGSDPSPEDGELVTRADGTQAIRVRRRKRRSHQPHKEQRLKKRRMLMIQLSAALILVLLFVLGFGIALLYANSGFFRKGLTEKIAATTGAKVRLEQFRVNPRGANAALIELEWPQSEAMKKILARDLNAKVAPQSFLGGRISGEEVVAREAIVWLGKPEASSQSATKDLPAPLIHFSRLAANEGQVLYGDPSLPIFKLHKTELSYMPRSLNAVSMDDIANDGFEDFSKEGKSLSE